MELIEIDENLCKLIELMLKFSKMYQNNKNETPALDLALRAGKN